MGKSALMGAGASGLGLLGVPHSAVAYSSKINEVLLDPGYPEKWPFRCAHAHALFHAPTRNAGVEPHRQKGQREA